MRSPRSPGVHLTEDGLRPRLSQASAQPPPSEGQAVLEVLQLTQDEPLPKVTPGEPFRLSGRKSSAAKGTLTRYVLTILPFASEKQP